MKRLLSLVSGDLLEPINDITDFPDATEETKDVILPFYQAGILTGTDDYGTFRANGTLSRAEMATMAARLIRPELRQEFTLKTVDDSRYTLTALDLKGGKPEGSWSTSSLLPVAYEDHWAMYCAAGSWYTPEAGTAFLDANEDGLVMMEAADGTYAVVDSTKDWAAVPFTPNWSCKLLGDGSFISQASNDADPILPRPDRRVHCHPHRRRPLGRAQRRPGPLPGRKRPAVRLCEHQGRVGHCGPVHRGQILP